MKRSIATLALLCAVMSAYATKPVETPAPTPANNTAVAGAAAISTAVAGAAAVVGVKNDIKLGGASVTAGDQTQTLNNSGNGTGQVLGSGNGTGYGGYGGSVYAERAAPSVVVGTQTQPIIDCRRTLGFGGSNTGGSVVASGIPLWKETDCAAMMALEAQVKAGPGAFTIADAQVVACKVEANEDTYTCKKVASARQAENEAKRPAVAVGPNAPMMP